VPDLPPSWMVLPFALVSSPEERGETNRQYEKSLVPQRWFFSHECAIQITSSYYLRCQSPGISKRMSPPVYLHRLLCRSLSGARCLPRSLKYRKHYVLAR